MLWKRFTSTGPLSFTPTSNWDVLYFLNARNWLKRRFTLYRIKLKRTSCEFSNLQINKKKKETYEQQAKQGRRPRLSWKDIKLQLEPFVEKIFEGSIDEICL